MQPGELQGEQRRAAGALQQYPVAGLDLAFDHQRLPGGQRGAGQGGGLFPRQVCGAGHHATFVEQYVFAEHAVERATQR
ncbi:hypothetical protein FQZ97_1218090 [compost metagenome]